MKVCSVTIAHNAGAKIGGALDCVEPHVDACFLFDTGITDATVDVAQAHVREKLRVVPFPWINDFSAARNFALKTAGEAGFDFAIMIDTDQRIAWNGIDPRDVFAAARLAGPLPACWTMRSAGETHVKEQIFTLPTERVYSDKTHEAFPIHGCPEWPRSRVWELGKSPEDLRAKLERDRAILQADIALAPSPRKIFYLAETLKNLGDKSTALPLYQTVRRTSSWDEEAGWSSYQAAVILWELERPLEALAELAAGITRHAGMPELPWYAAWISFQRGDIAQAMRWSRLAAAQGERFRTHKDEVQRGFSYPLARWDGPHSILEHCYRVLGETEKSQLEHARVLELIAERTPTPEATEHAPC